jgi:hypothetical protein
MEMVSKPRWKQVDRLKAHALSKTDNLSSLLFTAKNLPTLYFFGQQELINCLRGERKGKVWLSDNPCPEAQGILRGPGVEVGERLAPEPYQPREDGLLNVKN